MSSPAMPAAPAVRTPSTGGGGGEAKGTDSAAPFATALDGALSEGRAALGEGADQDAEQRDPGTPDGAGAPLGIAAPVTPPVGLTAALWALGLGAPQVTGQVPAADGATVPAVGAVPAADPPAGAAPTAGLPAAPAPAGAVPAAVLPTAVVPATSDVPGRPGTPLPAAASGSAPVPATAAAGAGPVPGAPDLVITAPAAGATPVTPAPAALTDAVAAAAPTAVPGAGTASSPGAGEDAGSATTGGEPAEVPATVSGAAPAAPLAATAGVDGATGAAADLPVAGQVTRHVAVLRGAPDGSHTMTLVLTPDTLGPVEVSVTVTDGTVDLVLRGAHEQGRAALLDALPDLRRDLEAAGLTTSRMAVDRETGGSWLARHHADQQAQQHAQQQSQQGSGQRPGQQEPGEERSRPWLRPADSEGSRSAPTTRSTSAGVDVRV